MSSVSTNTLSPDNCACASTSAAAVCAALGAACRTACASEIAASASTRRALAQSSAHCAVFD